MKTFISYSVDDINLVKEVADSIRAKCELNYWEEAHRPGDEAWPKIFGWIDSADLVLVIITDRTIKRAMSVGQEVGHARKAGKRIVPLVSIDIDVKDLGFLSGITFIPLDVRDPTNAVRSLNEEVDRLKVEEAKRQQALQQQQEKQNAVVTLAGIALVLFLLRNQ